MKTLNYTIGICAILISIANIACACLLNPEWQGTVIVIATLIFLLCIIFAVNHNIDNGLESLKNEVVSLKTEDDKRDTQLTTLTYEIKMLKDYSQQLAEDKKKTGDYAKIQNDMNSLLDKMKVFVISASHQYMIKEQTDAYDRLVKECFDLVQAYGKTNNTTNAQE